MDTALETYLAGRVLLAAERATWDTLRLRVRYYGAAEPPPDRLVTSARAIVLTPARVLVVREPSGDHHVIPGGRRRRGESLEDTVRREVLEETRWSIGELSILAVGHFHLVSPVPDDYPYPNPDFLQLIYLAQPVALHEDRSVEDDWVASSEMVPLAAVDGRPMSRTQHALLQHAVSRQAQSGHPC